MFAFLVGMLSSGNRELYGLLRRREEAASGTHSSLLYLFTAGNDDISVMSKGSVSGHHAFA